MVGCHFFGPNTNWVKAKGHHIFACPRCGERYRPGLKRTTLVDANFIWCIKDKSTGSSRFVLSQWPASAEETFFIQVMEQHADVDERFKEMEQTELMQYIHDQVHPASMDYTWSSMQLDPAIISKLDERSRWGSLKWDYSHLTNGFTGSHYRWSESTTVLNFKQLKILIALVKLVDEKIRDGVRSAL